MMNFRWFVLVLILSICSTTLVSGVENSEVKPRVRDDIEKSPRPNIDLYEVQLSLSSGWLDKIDEWFVETIKNGRNALAQLGRTGIKVLDHIIEFIPTPEAVFQAAKEVLFALPQEVVVYAMDAYCSVFFLFH